MVIVVPDFTKGPSSCMSPTIRPRTVRSILRDTSRELIKPSRTPLPHASTFREKDELEGLIKQKEIKKIQASRRRQKAKIQMRKDRIVRRGARISPAEEAARTVVPGLDSPKNKSYIGRNNSEWRPLDFAPLPLPEFGIVRSNVRIHRGKCNSKKEKALKTLSEKGFADPLTGIVSLMGHTPHRINKIDNVQSVKSVKNQNVGHNTNRKQRLLYFDLGYGHGHSKEHIVEDNFEETSMNATGEDSSQNNTREKSFQNTTKQGNSEIEQNSGDLDSKNHKVSESDKSINDATAAELLLKGFRRRKSKVKATESLADILKLAKNQKDGLYRHLGELEQEQVYLNMHNWVNNFSREKTEYASNDVFLQVKLASVFSITSDMSTTSDLSRDRVHAILQLLIEYGERLGETSPLAIVALAICKHSIMHARKPEGQGEAHTTIENLTALFSGQRVESDEELQISLAMLSILSGGNSVQERWKFLRRHLLYFNAYARNKGKLYMEKKRRKAIVFKLARRDRQRVVEKRAAENIRMCWSSAFLLPFLLHWKKFVLMKEGKRIQEVAAHFLNAVRRKSTVSYFQSWVVYVEQSKCRKALALKEGQLKRIRILTGNVKRVKQSILNKQKEKEIVAAKVKEIQEKLDDALRILRLPERQPPTLALILKGFCSAAIPLERVLDCGSHDILNDICRGGSGTERFQPMMMYDSSGNSKNVGEEEQEDPWDETKEEEIRSWVPGKHLLTVVKEKTPAFRPFSTRVGHRLLRWLNFQVAESGILTEEISKLINATNGQSMYLAKPLQDGKLLTTIIRTLSKKEFAMNRTKLIYPSFFRCIHVERNDATGTKEGVYYWAPGHVIPRMKYEHIGPGFKLSEKEWLERFPENEEELVPGSFGYLTREELNQMTNEPIAFDDAKFASLSNKEVRWVYVAWLRNGVRIVLTPDEFKQRFPGDKGFDFKKMVSLESLSCLKAALSEIQNLFQCGRFVNTTEKITGKTEPPTAEELQIQAARLERLKQRELSTGIVVHVMSKYCGTRVAIPTESVLEPFAFALIGQICCLHPNTQITAQMQVYRDKATVAACEAIQKKLFWINSHIIRIFYHNDVAPVDLSLDELDGRITKLRSVRQQLFENYIDAMNRMQVCRAERAAFKEWTSDIIHVSNQSLCTTILSRKVRKEEDLDDGTYTTVDSVQLQATFQKIGGEIVKDSTLQEDEIKKISQVLRQRIRDLKRIFAFYCAMGTSNDGNDDEVGGEASLDKAEYWRWVKDCKFQKNRKALPSVRLDLIFQNAMTDYSKTGKARIAGLSSNDLVAKQWINSLVRIACYRFQHVKPPLKLHKRVEKLLHEWIIPNAYVFRDRVALKEVQARLTAMRRFLKPIFNEYAADDDSDAAINSLGTVNVNELTTFAKECNLFGPLFGYRSLRTIFCYCQQEEEALEENEEDGEESEMVYSEFKEVVVAISCFMRPNPYVTMEINAYNFVNEIVMPALVSLPRFGGKKKLKWKKPK